jgi:glycosyltransferase involved in cell wall biosynthesis
MSSEQQPRVSVITPVYNCEAYLSECIESVLAQTYNNWDYTIVNNCSTDGTRAIAESYAAKDSRIRLHNNERFLRAIPNHSVAFSKISAESKYAKMVFGDDWLFPECISKMVSVAETNPSVGIVGAYGLRGSSVVWTGLPYPSTVVSGIDVCRRFFLERTYVFGTATSQLIRCDLIRSRQPFYNESNLHADMEVCIELLKTCDFGFVHQVLTYTRERSESLSELSRHMNTLTPGRLHDLVTHGSDFLTSEELAACVEDNLGEYYSFLARNAAQGRDRAFWNFHKHKLEEAGLKFSRARLARTMLAKIVNSVLNPKQLIEELVQGRSVLSKGRRYSNLSRVDQPSLAVLQKSS